MKKLSLIVFAIFFALLQSSSLYARADVGEPSPVATLHPEIPSSTIGDVTIPTAPGETGSGVCEVDEGSIPEIQFYAGNCMNRVETDYVDVDLNLHCLTSKPVFLSYCRESNVVCSGDLCIPYPETAASCLRRNHCPVPSTPPPTSMTPETPDSPVLASISPSTVVEGSSAFSMTVTGTHFVNASVVLWNGRSKTTTYVSATELHAQIDAEDIAHASTVPVTVMNGTLLSNAVNFTVTAASSTDVDTSTTHTGGTETTTLGTSPNNGTDLIPVNSANGGGCSLGIGSSESMSFMSVAFGFLIGSYFMVRKKR